MNQQSVSNFSKSNGNIWAQLPMDYCMHCIYIKQQECKHKKHMHTENLTLNDKQQLENSKKYLINVLKQHHTSIC